MTIHRTPRPTHSLPALLVVLPALLAALAPAAGARQAEPVSVEQAEPFLLHLVPVGFQAASSAEAAQGEGAAPSAEQVPADSTVPRRVEVVAEALTALRGDAEPPPARTAEGVEVPGTVEMNLVPGFVWRLSVSGGGAWAPPAVVLLEEPGGEETLPVWPVGRVRGRLATDTPGAAAADGLPAALRVHFESVPGAVARSQDERAPREDSPEVPRTVVDCPVEEGGAFSCSLPAGLLDLRLAAGGFVPVYRWGVAVPPAGEVDLGAVPLERGASLAGWVVVEDDELDPEEARVTVAPQAAGVEHRPREQERRARMARETEVDERGFFQLAGLRPGAYVVTAKQPGLAVARRGPVELEEAEETLLRAPLVLTPPLTLEVWIEPALDPAGEPWAVEVSRFREPTTPADDLRERATAAPDGTYELGGLSAGRYAVGIFGPDGSQLAREEVELDRSTGPVRIALDLIALEGLLLLGDQPLEGRVTFSGGPSAAEVVMDADEEGAFGGLLPGEGGWRIDVTADEPRVRRRLWREIEAEDGRAEVEVRLPDTLVAGRVVDVEGRRVSGAAVKVVGLDEVAIPFWGHSADDGTFAIHGLAEGLVYVDATATGGRTSEKRVVDLAEDRSAEDLELVVRERETVRGRVLSPAGPVVGAEVMATARRGGAEQPFAFSSPGMTDAEGRFELQVPAGTDGVDLVVLPPGFALAVRRVEPLPEEPIRVRVEPHGGTLAVAGFAPEGLSGKPPPGSLPVVLFEGVPLGAGPLGDWIRVVGEGSPWWKGPRLVVPRMPPGNYAVCRPDMVEVIRALARGKDVRPLLETSCDRGYLPPYGELELVAPEPPEAEEGRGGSR